MRTISLVVALAACTTREPAPQAPAPTKQQLVEKTLHRIETPPAALPRHEYTRLLDAGAEPRALARYALAPGTTTARVASAMRSRVFADRAWGPWTDIPATSDGLAVTVAADPHRPLAFRVANRIAFATVDDRGQLGPVSFGDQAAPNDATQRLLGLVVQLPVEPVGIGATWRAVDVLRQHAAIVKQTVTYTLLARTAGSLRIAVEIVRNGQPQSITDAALPPGTDAELETLHRSLRGTIEVDLARPIFNGTLELDARMHVRIAPATGAVQEQMFEDTGTIGVSS